MFTVKRNFVGGSVGVEGAGGAGPAMVVAARATNDKRDEANIVKQPRKIRYEGKARNKAQVESWYSRQSSVELAYLTLEMVLGGFITKSHRAARPRYHLWTLYIQM